MPMPMLLEGSHRADPFPNTASQIESLREELRVVREQWDAERRKSRATEEGLMSVREILTPLYRSLRLLYGEMDAIGVQDGPVGGSGVDPRVAKAWESWKDRLGGGAAKAIDALLLHGPMNMAQLRIQMGCAMRTCQNVVQALKRAGLIDKNNGKIALKEL